MSTLPPTRIPSGSRGLARDARARILLPALDAIRGVIDARDNLFCEGILLKGFRSRISEERENAMKVGLITLGVGISQQGRQTTNCDHPVAGAIASLMIKYPLIPRITRKIRQKRKQKEKHTFPISRNRLCARLSLVASIIPRSASVWCRRASMASM